MRSKNERHNLEINPLGEGKGYHVYCSYGDLNLTCRTERAARAYVFLHAVDGAVRPQDREKLYHSLLETDSD
jgi:hypothetical protein